MYRSRVEELPRENAMRVPSGDQLGSASKAGDVGLVTCRRSEPSPLTVQICPDETNAMRPFSPGNAACAG
jgi:hypothetical protein